MIIDGVEVDLKPGERITLNFKSNFMGDVSKIESSNSLTINLPKTPRNNALFSYAGNPASGSTFPYRRWPAKYYRDGVEVISVGYCVLVEVGESYNVALYWGTMANFQAWLDSEETLQQLDYSAGPNTSYTWGEEQLSDATSSDGVIIANYDTGVGSFADLPASVGFNPTVRVSSILKKIEDRWGMRFSFAFLEEDTAAGRTILDRLGLPLVTSKGRLSVETQLTNVEILNKLESWVLTTGYAKFCVYGFEFDNESSGFFRTDEGPIPLNGFAITGKRVQVIDGGKVRFGNSIVLKSTSQTVSQGITPSVSMYAVTLTAEGAYHKSVEIAGTWEQGPTVSGENTRVWTFGTTEQYFIEVTEGGFVGFVAESKYCRIYEASGAIDIRLPETDTEELEVGDAYQVQWNLPEIKQIDFVKAISHMLGLYALQTINQTNTVAFVSIDSLIRKKSNANDWSDKLVKGQRDGSPESVSFKLDSWARENYFRYKEDDTVLNQGEGVLTVPNENLDASADALTLPFAASDWSVVPIYERKSDGGIERKDIEPRIMQIVATEEGKAALTFSGLGWQALLGKYYGGQGRMLERVVVIKVKVRLSDIDLKNLSFARPVYLAQYGRFYAIRSVSTSSSNECSAELIQLPLD